MAWDDDDRSDSDFDDEEDDEQGSDTETCPHCGEEIYAAAEQCPHCRQYVSDEDSAGESGWLPGGRGARRRYPWWVLVGALLAVVSALLILI